MLARANSRLAEVLAHSVLTAGSEGVRTLFCDIRVFGLTLEQCWHTVCQHCSREVLARANSTPGQVLAQSVLTAGSRGVRTHWRQVSADMTSKIAHILLKIARIFLLASARRRTCVPTVCQQRRWQVLEHCANSRIRAGVGPKSVLTVDVSVLTLERRPWLGGRR